MTTWTADELIRIATSDELQIAPRRSDGTLRSPIPIWNVRLGDDLYVRSVNGRTAAWFLAAQERHEGHIQSAGVGKDVTFAEENTAGISDELDAAYRAKYHRYAANIVDSIVSPQARSATLKLIPHS